MTLDQDTSYTELEATAKDNVNGEVDVSLDVKATADQKDPIGTRPLDTEKEFQSVVLVEDRESVERLTGSNPNIIHLLYGNDQIAVATLPDVKKGKKLVLLL